MTGYVVRRVIAALVTVWLVLSGIFLIFFVMPGGAGKKSLGGFSPVAVFIAGRNNSPSSLRQIERDLGLDKSLQEQYFQFISRSIRGDLGFSYEEAETPMPVGPMVRASFRPTLELALGASVVALAAGIGGGILAARGRSRWSDRVMSGFSIVALSIPAFVSGSLALALLNTSDLYDFGQYVPMSAGLGAWLEGMWLPWVILALPFIGIYFRLVRSSLLEIRSEDFIRTAWAKGLSERDVLRHQLRAGSMPVVTAFGVDLANFLGGAIIVETVLGIPGLGGLIVGATRGSDFPVIAGVTIVASIAVVFMTLAVDIAYTYLDPRITYGSNPDALD